MRPKRPLQELSLLELKSQFNHLLPHREESLLGDVISLVNDQSVYQAYCRVKTSLKHNISSAFPQYLAGRLALIFGDLELAKSHLSQALYHAAPIRDLLHHCFISLSNLLFSCHQTEELRALLLWRKSQGVSYELHFMFGALYESEGKLAPALTSYKAALKIYTRSSQSQLAIARCLYMNGDFHDALNEVKVLHTSLAKSSYTWILTGQIYLAHNRAEDAVKALKRAQRLNPRSALTHQLLGDYYQDVNAQKAIGHYQRSLSSDHPSFILYVKLARIYQRLKRYDEAIAQLSLYRCFLSADEQRVIHREISQLKTLKRTQELSNEKNKSWIKRWF